MLKRKQKIPSQEKDPTPDCFQFEPCLVKRMSSKVLGEKVEQIRDELSVHGHEDERYITLKG